MKYAKMNWGMMEAIINKLGGMNGVQKFLSGETSVQSSVPLIGETRKVRLGNGLQTAQDFCKALSLAGMKANELACSTLQNPAFVEKITKVENDIEVALVSIADLGFKTDTPLSEIYAEAKEHDLTICPPEVGPQLRLQYFNQPKGERLILAMHPITCKNGYDNEFYITHNHDGLVFGARNVQNQYRSHDCSRFVFLRRKSLCT